MMDDLLSSPKPEDGASEAMDAPVSTRAARTLARLQADAMAGNPWAMAWLWHRFWTFWWLH